MTTVAPPAPGSSRLGPSRRSRARRARSAVATALIAATFLIAMVPLVFLVVYVVQKGGVVFGWDFLTENPPKKRKMDRLVIDDDAVEIKNHGAKHHGTITEIFFYFN